MTRVLIFAGTVPGQQATLAERLDTLRGMGCQVAMVVNCDPELLTFDRQLADVYSLLLLRGEYSRRLQRALGGASPSRRVWLLARRNAAVRALAAQADVLVALDQTAILTVWELAQRHRRPAAVHGLEPALRAVAAHQQSPAGAARSVAASVPAWGGVALRGVRQGSLVAVTAVLRSAVSPAVLRTGPGTALWTAMVGLPKVPERVRRRVALTVHTNMLKAGRFDQAVRASALAASRMADRHLTADMLVRQAQSELAYGTPASMAAAMTASLDVADQLIARKEARKVAPVLDRAMRLLFHRSLHFDRTTSPLADDPAGYLAQWRASSAARALSAPRGRGAAALPRDPGRPLRLLFAVDSTGGLFGESDENLLTDIRRRYEDMPGVDVRFLDFAAHEELSIMTLASRQIIDQISAGSSVYGNKIEAVLRPYLDWADTVFIDACQGPAAMVSLIDPGTTRIVVRMHGFEPYTYWPQLVDFTRVDDLIFVSAHTGDLAVEVVPQLSAAGAPRRHTLTPAVRLRDLDRPKRDGARFTIAQIGVGDVAKDPRWAIEVLGLLRERDDRYRLLYFGDPLDPEESNDVANYEQAWSRDIARLEGAVHRCGHVNDLPAMLTEVGVVLNGSVRESFPRPIVQAAASGAVPVVRNWPFFAGRRHSAHTTFPTDWVVDSAEEAAERIIKVTESEDVWREAGRLAAAHAVATWDWTRVAADYDAVLLRE
jgi:glycosyltransferase involved in cell wall biosynthesis